jgi:ribosome biogenesis GTPase
VRAAAASGALPADRLESFHKLKGELRHLAIKQDEGAQSDQRRRWRTIHKAAKKHKPRG